MAQEPIAGGSPLTVLAEDEQLLRDSVLEFADQRVRPLVREMDEHAKMPRDLIDDLFGLGVMGIEVPEAFGGAGARFFHSVLAVEALSQVDPSVGLLVDVQNTLVTNALIRWGSDDIKQRYLPAMATKTVGAYALSESGSGSDAFAMTTRATAGDGGFVLNGRKLWITNGNEADLFIVFATVNPEAGYRGHHGVPRRARRARLHRGQEGGQARHPRQQHLRAALRGLLRGRRQRAGRGGQGLQGRNRDAQRGAHRHRRADDRPRAGRARPRRRLHEGAQAVRQGDRRLPGGAVPARAGWRPSSRPPGSWSTTPPGSATRAGRS